LRLARDLLVVEDERVEVSVAGVEDVADPEAVLALELGDPAQHLRELRPRDDAVLDVVAARDAAHRGERSLAALPAQPPPGAGRRSSRSVISVAIPSVPSEPTNAPSSPGPGSSACSSTTSPVGSTAVTASTWLTVNPCLRQCAPPEFSATLPPIVHTCWLEG